jgi:hypothetical protein
VEEWPALLGPIYRRLRTAAGGERALEELAYERPWALAAYIGEVYSPLFPEWRGLVEGNPPLTPLLRFTPRGEGRALPLVFRCGPGLVLADPARLPRILTSRCPVIARVLSEAGLYIRGRPLAVERPFEAFCRVVEALARRLEIPADPWEAASLYAVESGARRRHHHLAAWLYLCQRKSLAEADYLLERIRDVEPEARLKIVKTWVKTNSTSPLQI